MMADAADEGGEPGSGPFDPVHLKGEEVDVDVLWRQLLVAKEAGDGERVRAIENRMRQLQGERRFAHLSDAELEQRIRALSREREPRDMLGHSPGGGPGGDSAGGEDTMRMNEAIRGNQHVGIEATLNALVDERNRRRA